MDREKIFSALFKDDDNNEQKFKSFSQITPIGKRVTAESKTNRSLSSVWSKISTFHMGLVFRKVIPRPGLV